MQPGSTKPSYTLLPNFGIIGYKQQNYEYVNVSPTPNQGGCEVPIAGSGDTVANPIPPQPPKEANDPSNTGSEAGSGSSQSQNRYNIPHHSKSKSSIPHLPSSPGFGISWDQAEKAIDDFTTIFTAHLPFVILDHDITARRLFVEKPLLFRAILMIAIDFTFAKSHEIRRSIDTWIGQHILAMEEQNLGALQGLIVYIAWANPHFYSDRKGTQLMYFAVGLAHSLGITREPTPKNTQAKKESEINEEHRAFLACYYFLSFNSFQFGRPNPLSTTSHVQYCVDSLERSSEFATDFLLIKLVKFRQFIGRVPNVYQGLCDMKWCREISADASEELNEIRKDLDDLISDVSHKHPKLQNERASRLQLECMQYCFQASQKFVSMAKSFSPDGFLYAPFTTLTDIIAMLIATSRLLLVEVDGWDLEKARQNIDVKAAIDEVIAKLSVANKVKIERVAAAALVNPSSYKADGADEEKHNQLQIFVKLIESIGSWLDKQGAFLSSNEEPGQRRNSTDETRTPARAYAGPQSPLWNFTFFFESLLQISPS
ncbi:hypothetical protein E0Z10_g9163 [Xylaria hypoxylon]|uniref:Xylanolytic transcriptional activator regulatory domain-containing protein n=1 Tax=Xylaria hypoxylon TaxID=37992 RepID=A0A4Z0Y9G9_9PEZI|nr:hypothetical protein E0Z10_g9163 [Xylaria hypoxylon]